MRIIVLSILGFFLAFSSCQKDDETIVNKDGDIFYVKYEISGNGTYGRFSNWSVTTPNRLYVNTGYQTRYWMQTYGPVNKGFNCEVKIDNYISGSPSINILVSKNNEPFAIVLTTSGKSASYIVQ
ncbi:hypothetical protein GCM10022216_15090 [Sphingobacterium kyonggiense]|uniref:Uncharacterized protein n=1 Tax=Sphingobacterium kyonggiense TaxID=714075 RepID=A0ABP7YM62_9SPHI